MHPEKWSAFKKAYEAVEQWVSVLSAIEQGHHSHIPLFKSHTPFNHPDDDDDDDDDDGSRPFFEISCVLQ